MMKKRISVLCFLMSMFTVLGISSLYAQNSMMAYHLSNNALFPQTNMLNPVFFTHYKVTIGFPPSAHVAVNNSGIAFRDLFINNGNNTFVLDEGNIPNKVRSIHNVAVEASAQLFYLGLRFNKNYFSLGLHTILEVRGSLPSSLFKWALWGPADSRVNNGDISLDNINAKTLLYHQISLGYSRVINEKLRVGLRVKYLMGIGGAELNPVKASAHVDLDAIRLQSNRLTGNLFGVTDVLRSGFTLDNILNKLSNPSGGGLGFDVGASYQLNDRFSFSAAVNDLGFIVWYSNNRTYTTDPINYSFTGFSVLDVIDNRDIAARDIFQTEVNKLADQFNYQEIDGGKVITSLIGKAYFSASYRVFRRQHLRALFYMDIFKGQVNPAVSLAYTVPLGKIFNGVIGGTYKNGEISNLGLGIALKLGPLQIHVSSDRVNSAYNFTRAAQADAQAGFNLFFGNPDRDAKVKKRTPPKKFKPERIVPDSLFVEPELESPTPLLPEIDPIEPKKEIDPKPKKEIELVPEMNQREPRRVIIKRKDIDAVLLGHYVVVGAYRTQDGLKRYTKALNQAGYVNKVLYIKSRNINYVYTMRNDDIEVARTEVYRLRSIGEFEFPKAWILTIE